MEKRRLTIWTQVYFNFQRVLRRYGIFWESIVNNIRRWFFSNVSRENSWFSVFVGPGVFNNGSDTYINGDIVKCAMNRFGVHFRCRRFWGLQISSSTWLGCYNSEHDAKQISWCHCYIIIKTSYGNPLRDIAEFPVSKRVLVNKL